MAEYKLSASLVGHGNDVRAVLFPSPKTLLSASRDGTVRSWKLLSDNPPVFDATISSKSPMGRDGPAWLLSLAYLPPNKQFSEGLIISGGKEPVIDVRQPSKTPDDNAEALLLGHTDTVSALAVDPAGKYIVSGSWDKTARIWPLGKWDSEAILQGHTSSVLAILLYDSETIITACPDTFIRIYTTNGLSGKLLRSIPGGHGIVRALCVLKNHPSGADFASAGNDSAIRLWKISGEQVGELRGHDDKIIFQLASSPSGEIFSVGDDGALRVWGGSECVQTITHPAASVWCVAVCQETGDVVTGASDYIVRVLTREPSRAADAETIQQFDASVKEYLDSLKKHEIPGPEFLKDQSGTKEGQIQKIQESNGSVSIHQWTAGEWNLIGHEPDHVMATQLVMPGGQSKALQIPWFRSDGISETATKFLEENKITGQHQEVVEFIISSLYTEGKLPHDTFETLPQNLVKALPDDLREKIRKHALAKQPKDEPQPQPQKKILPQKAYLSIMNADVSKFKDQITKINKSLIDDARKDISLNSKELQAVFACCNDIQNPRLSKNYKNTRDTLDTCVKIITQWPYSDRVGAMGILFLLGGQVETANYRHSQGPSEQDIINILLSSCKESDPPKENYIVMTIRAIVNLFASPSGISLAKSNFLQYQALITSSLDNGSTNRNLLIAIATLYQNLSVVFHDAGLAGATPDSEIVYEVLTTLPKILARDPVVAERGLTALGTFLDIGVGVKKLAEELKSEETINEVVKKYIGEPKIKQLGVELKGLFVIENEDTKMEG